mmetsp:Transcript_28935/g.93437  ORF Transcript_28935/g.93437 Transcript_28935/m.93437 type:complete len:245 (+) Transcript_28935:225-959(+)
MRLPVVGMLADGVRAAMLRLLLHRLPARVLRLCARHAGAVLPRLGHTADVDPPAARAVEPAAPGPRRRLPVLHGVLRLLLRLLRLARLLPGHLRLYGRRSAVCNRLGAGPRRRAYHVPPAAARVWFHVCDGGEADHGRHAPRQRAAARRRDGSRRLPRRPPAPSRRTAPVRRPQQVLSALAPVWRVPNERRLTRHLPRLLRKAPVERGGARADAGRPPRRGARQVRDAPGLPGRGGQGGRRQGR